MFITTQSVNSSGSIMVYYVSPIINLDQCDPVLPSSKISSSHYASCLLAQHLCLVHQYIDSMFWKFLIHLWAQPRPRSFESFCCSIKVLQILFVFSLRRSHISTRSVHNMPCPTKMLIRLSEYPHWDWLHPWSTPHSLNLSLDGFVFEPLCPIEVFFCITMC